MIRRVVIGAGIAAASWVGYMSLRHWWATWGVDTGGADQGAPG